MREPVDKALLGLADRLVAGGSALREVLLLRTIGTIVVHVSAGASEQKVSHLSTGFGLTSSGKSVRSCKRTPFAETAGIAYSSSSKSPFTYIASEFLFTRPNRGSKSSDVFSQKSVMNLLSNAMYFPFFGQAFLCDVQAPWKSHCLLVRRPLCDHGLSSLSITEPRDWSDDL